MPSSQFSYIPSVLELILELPHGSILDVGPGFGKYGVLCREYCDLIPTWYEKGLSGFDRKNWQIKIDCVEPFQDYITPLHRYVYDEIFTGKIEDLLETLESYDLMLFIGVLEHMEKSVGQTVLRKCKQKAKAIVLVTPDGYRSQDAVWGNPCEKHKAGWGLEELESLGFTGNLLLPGNKILAHFRGDE